VDKLLDYMVQSFKKTIVDRIIIDKGIYRHIPDFSDEFFRCRRKWEIYNQSKSVEKTKMRNFGDTEKGMRVAKKKKGKNSSKKKKKKKKKEDEKEKQSPQGILS